MSKYQTCRQCGSMFPGPDVHHNDNLCPSCDKELHRECRAEIARLTQENERLQHDNSEFCHTAAAWYDKRNAIAKVIVSALPVLEDAASLDRECLGVHEPPSPDEQGWCLIDEMIDAFKKAIATAELQAQEAS